MPTRKITPGKKPPDKKVKDENQLLLSIYDSSMAYEDGSTVGVPKIPRWWMRPCCIPALYVNHNF